MIWAFVCGVDEDFYHLTTLEFKLGLNQLTR